MNMEEQIEIDKWVAKCNAMFEVSREDMIIVPQPFKLAILKVMLDNWATGYQLKYGSNDYNEMIKFIKNVFVIRGDFKEVKDVN